jgi:hypothetical protein
MKHLIVVAGAVLVCGCTDAGVRVTDLEGGKHHLAIRSQSDEATDRANAIQLADNYCRKSSQRAVIEGFDNKGSFVASPSTGVVFTCK